MESDKERIFACEKNDEMKIGFNRRGRKETAASSFIANVFGTPRNSGNEKAHEFLLLKNLQK
jgi:hypothetical protein